MTYLVKIPVTTGTKKAAVTRVHGATKVYIRERGSIDFYRDDTVIASFSTGNWLYFIEEGNEVK